jgi:hypothetical protein
MKGLLHMKRISILLGISALTLSATHVCALPLSVDLATHPASQEWVQQHFGVAGHFIGEYFGGGVVFWVDPTSPAGNQHGLIADIKDRPGTYDWDTTGSSSTGALGNSAYSGRNSPGGNTYIILHTIGAARGQAANACAASNAQGHTDWYLPSIGELTTLLSVQIAVTQTALAQGGTGFNSDFIAYWSSTEYSSSNAWYFYPYAYGDASSKDTAFLVRCVRSY